MYNLRHTSETINAIILRHGRQLSIHSIRKRKPATKVEPDLKYYYFRPPPGHSGSIGPNEHKQSRQIPEDPLDAKS